MLEDKKCLFYKEGREEESKKENKRGKMREEQKDIVKERIQLIANEDKAINERERSSVGRA